MRASDAFARYELVWIELKSCERYVSPGMFPFAAQPLAHCSTTRTRSSVGFGCRWKLPTPNDDPPKAASRSRRSLTVESQLAWVRTNGRLRIPTASGETSGGSEPPGVAPVHLRHSD